MIKNWLKSSLFVLVSLYAASVSATENAWTGAAGDNLWTNAANWSLATLPDSSQDVLIQDTGGNPVVLDAPAVIGSLTLGSAEGAATLSITGGTLQCYGPAQVQTNSSLSLAGDLTAWTFQVDGTVDWTGGSLTALSATTVGPSGHVLIRGFANALAGAFCNNGTVDCSVTNLVANAGLQFTNNNRLVLHANLALTAPDGGFPYPAFYNSGTILVPTGAGTVVLAPGYMFFNQGTLLAETNAVLEVSPGGFSPVVFQSGTIFDGAGLVRFTGGGEFSCTGTMLVNGTVELARSSAFGYGATWTGPGLLRWLGGEMNSFTFGPAFQVEMSSPAAKVISGNCTNLGVIAWLDAASLAISSSGNSSFYNYGQFTLRTNCTLVRQEGGFGQSTFINFGSLVAPAGGGTVPLVMGCTFYNQGALRAETNAVLEVRPSGYAAIVFQTGTVFQGEGLMRFTGGGNFACDGTVLVNGTVELSGGSAYGIGALWTGPGLFRWLGGEMNSFTFAPGFQVEMSGPADKIVSGNSTNLGSIAWLDSTSLVVGSSGSSTFYNYGQFTFHAACTLVRQDGGLGQSTFDNYGTLAAPAASGTLPLVVGCTFYNQGTLLAETNAVLEVRPSGYAAVAFQTGTVFEGEGLVRFAGGGNFACDGTVQVNGTVELSGSSAYGIGAMWTGPGLFRWLSGEMNSFTFAPGFQVEMRSSADKIVSGNSTNLGAIAWLDSASLAVGSSGSSSFYNYGQFTLEAPCALATQSGGFGQSTFNNLGALVVPAGSGALPLTVGCTFYNQGTLVAETNSVLEVRLSDFAAAVFQTGTAFDGAGLVRFTSGGNFACDGTMLVKGTVELAGSSAYGIGAVWTGPGLFRWLGGEMNSFTFSKGFQVELRSPADKVVSGNSTNLGTVAWLDAASLVIASSGDSSFNNYGQFTLQTNCTLARQDGGFGQSTFNNLGSLIAPAGGGTVPLVVGCAFYNQGTLRAEVGAVLEVHPSGYAAVVFQPGTSFDGAGVVRFTGGGNFACNGTMQVNGTVELAGSSAYGMGAAWTGPGLLRWLAGELDAFTFGTGFQVEMNSTADKLMSGNCTNLGTVR